MRHEEPHTSAFWRTLSCGHVTEVAVSDLGWKPANGPDRVSADRLREMHTEFEEFWAQQPDAQDLREREHIQRMLADGWPSPAPEELCYTCPRAPQSLSRASASAGLSRARPNLSLRSRQLGPACSSGCGRPEPRPPNCDAS